MLSPEEANPGQKLSKAESARINGAKSTGPASDAGRANSANANLKHGAWSKRILMDGESQEGYDLFRASFCEHFLPSDPLEAECLDAMISARWRIRRLEAMETTALNHALLTTQPAVEAQFEQIDTVGRRGVAVLSQLPTLDSSSKVQERLQRIYDRNYKLFAAHRRNAGKPVPDADPTPKPQEQPATSPELTNDPTATSGRQPNLTTRAALFLIRLVLLILKPRLAKVRIRPDGLAKTLLSAYVNARSKK